MKPFTPSHMRQREKRASWIEDAINTLKNSYGDGVWVDGLITAQIARLQEELDGIRKSGAPSCAIPPSSQAQEASE